MTTTLPLQFDKQAISLLAYLYLGSALLLHIVSFFVWGGFSVGGHPPLWDLEEFAACSGTGFVAHLVITTPVLLFLYQQQQRWTIKQQAYLLLALFPGYVFAVDQLEYCLLRSQGWEQLFGGHKAVLNYYFKGLFFFIQFGFIYAYRYFRLYQTQALAQQELQLKFQAFNLATPVSPPNYKTHLAAQKGNKLQLVRTTEVFYISAFGDYCKIHLAKQDLLSNSRLSEVLEQLDPCQFKRVHRSAIVNLDQIMAIDKRGRNFYLQLANGTEVRVSERYNSLIKSLKI